MILTLNVGVLDPWKPKYAVCTAARAKDPFRSSHDGRYGGSSTEGDEYEATTACTCHKCFELRVEDVGFGVAAGSSYSSPGGVSGVLKEPRFHKLHASYPTPGCIRCQGPGPNRIEALAFSREKEGSQGLGAQFISRISLELLGAAACTRPPKF